MYLGKNCGADRSAWSLGNPEHKHVLRLGGRKGSGGGKGLEADSKCPSTNNAVLECNTNSWTLNILLN